LAARDRSIYACKKQGRSQNSEVTCTFKGGARVQECRRGGAERFQVCAGRTPGTWLCAGSCDRDARCECIFGGVRTHKFEEYTTIEKQEGKNLVTYIYIVADFIQCAQLCGDRRQSSSASWYRDRREQMRSL